MYSVFCPHPHPPPPPPRRDKWKEGIASVAWSELPSEDDMRGEEWHLNMEIGPSKAPKVVQVPMPPGSAYVLMGPAQGCTRHCERRSVGHAKCNCCWTHGVRLCGGIARQSCTIRRQEKKTLFSVSPSMWHPHFCHMTKIEFKKTNAGGHKGHSHAHCSPSQFVPCGTHPNPP